MPKKSAALRAAYSIYAVKMTERHGVAKVRGSGGGGADFESFSGRLDPNVAKNLPAGGQSLTASPAAALRCAQ